LKNLLLVMIAWILVYALAPAVFVFMLLFYLLYSTKEVILRYLVKVAIGLDQLGAAILDWDEDETISSGMGRRKLAGELRFPFTVICRGLELIDKDHCIKNIGE